MTLWGASRGRYQSGWLGTILDLTIYGDDCRICRQLLGGRPQLSPGWGRFFIVGNENSFPILNQVRSQGRGKVHA
jgi:hypothetical protein